MTDDAITEARRLLEEIRQCINDEDLMDAQRDVLAVEKLLKEATALEQGPSKCMVCRARDFDSQYGVGSALQAAEARATAAEEQANAIDCPLCGESVKLVASATLSLALWQHVNWTCPVSPNALQAQLTAARAYMDHLPDCKSQLCARCGDTRDGLQHYPGTVDPCEQFRPGACTCGLDAALPPTPEATEAK